MGKGSVATCVALVIAAMVHDAYAQEIADQQLAGAQPVGGNGENTIPVPATASGPAVEEQAADGKRDARAYAVEEIIVTAQKREENLQNVPISVAAFSGEQLADMGISQPTDLSKITPGMQMTEAVGFSVSYLRGVGADGFLMADPSVATYIDGVYFPIAMGVEQKFGVLERIEVLKGPQGTLFGRNAVGGAINVVSKRPVLDVLDVKMSQEVGDYEKTTTTLYVNIPIGDATAIGVSGILDSRDSYYSGAESVTISDPNGRPVHGENSSGGKIRLLNKPVDWLSILLNASYVDDTGVKGLYAPNVEPSPLGAAIGIRAQKGFDNTKTSDPALLWAHSRVFSGEINAEFNSFDVKLMASDQRFRAQNAIDIDGSALPVAGFGLKNYFGDINTAELQFLSTDSSWLADRLKWVMGVYYFDSTQGVDPSDLFVASIDLTEGTFAGIQLPPSLVTLLNEAATPVQNIIPNGKIIFDGVLGTKSYSGYGQGTLSMTDWFSLTLGLRYQDEKRTVISSRSYLETLDGQKGPQYLNAGNVPPVTSKKLAPKVTAEVRPQADWLPGEDLLIYATWQQAEKAGLYNVINVIDATADKIKPEEMTAYELGFKSLFFDGAVRASGAVFYYDQKDLQIQYFSLLAGGAIQFQNADAAEVKGAELELTARPVQGMTVNLGGAYLDSKFTDFRDGSGYDEQTGLFSTNQDYTGNRIPRSPKYTVRAGVAQMFEIGDGNVEFGLDYYYNSGYFTMAANTSRNEQPAYELLNGRLTWEYSPWQTRVTGFVQNIADERYSVSKFDTDFGSIAALAAPRTYGVKLEWSLR